MTRNIHIILLLLSIVCIAYSIYTFTQTNEHYDSISNKFAFNAGPITPLECGQRCSQRYTKCMSYGNENINWCNHLYNSCTDDCEWNTLW